MWSCGDAGVPPLAADRAALVARVRTLPRGVRARHRRAVACVLALFALEWFLPYSHFLTRGYNGWTNGLYGYSWDMMIHSWSEMHTRLEVVRANGTRGKDSVFLKPHYLVHGRRRYVTHPDMIYQYVGCLKRELTPRLGAGFSIYLDLWNSMNARFRQRFVDPNYDFGGARELEWSPFEDTKWMRPCIFV